jgi:hypothetical protein
MTTHPFKVEHMPNNLGFNPPQQREEQKGQACPAQRDLLANILQVAVINKMLPKGFKFELQDTIKRQAESSTTNRIIPAKRKNVRPLFLNPLIQIISLPPANPANFISRHSIIGQTNMKQKTQT